MGFDSGIRIHPREKIVAKAKFELVEFMVNLRKTHELTHGEMFNILSGEMAEEAKYLIRFERHGNYEKKGGEA